MKKILLIFVLILLFPLFCHSTDLNKINGAVVGSSAGNTTKINGVTWGTTAGNYTKWNGFAATVSSSYACDSPTDADQGCEDFQGTSSCTSGESYCRIATWSCSETGGTIVVGAMGGTNSCTDKGTRSVTISKTAANEDLGCTLNPGTYTTGTTVYFAGMFRPISGSDGNTNGILAYGNSSWSEVLAVKMYTNNGGSTYYLQAGGTNGTHAMNVGTWYEIRVAVTRAGAFTVYIDGVSDITGTAADYDIYYVSLSSYHTTANYSVEWGTIKIDDDTMPDACGG